MKPVKHPVWDKQQHDTLIMVSPDSSQHSATSGEPLAVGQQAWAAIGGVEVKVLLTNLLTPTEAEARIIRIRKDKGEDQETLGDLSIDDTVLIARKDIRWLDIDVANSS